MGQWVALMRVENYPQIKIKRNKKNIRFKNGILKIKDKQGIIKSNKIKFRK